MNPFKEKLVILLSVILFLSGFAPSFPEEPAADGMNPEPATPVSRLVGKAAMYDGRTVTLEGELVGDVMKRGAHEWICVLDDGTAIGVWADSTTLYSEMLIGGYDAQGDTVRITGEFHRACSDHGGDLDIHLETIELLAPGAKIAHPVPLRRAIAAFMFCISGCLFTFLWKRREGGS